ncbi:thiamine-phosphate kinase [Oscillatoria sp. FACHB-1406]|uniref:thiamine-phosphate kinase n=1 Tax=Oscillatoria sp. FACHB-1406 TaxID=2692846 RepID=UPI001683A982|nr:thiamine-phosphate kinase [Oscillatoria sp. FACHB-1406]MBD2576701.1 thiamine-phosphate kinase [Oscillatoria sp. FACHB-1406]
MSVITVGEIGEQGLLQRVQRFCPTEVIGDDAAIIALTPGKSLVVTTDVLVENVHFSDATTTPEDVGWRATAANLSDLAAMGASPLGITVGLGLRGDIAVNWVESLYKGLQACLKSFNTAIVGGDLCRSPVITVSITAFGQVSPQQAIRRSGARVGDAIVATGYHGASRAGLELLLHPELGQNLSARDRDLFILAHQRPKPRLDVVPILTELVGGRSAGMDSSDGLADAVVQICRASGVGAELDLSAIPLPPGLEGWMGRERALEWALYGGEDFELILCLPEARAAQLVEGLGSPATVIGKIVAHREVIAIDSQGNIPRQVLSLERGFQHF